MVYKTQPPQKNGPADIKLDPIGEVPYEAMRSVADAVALDVLGPSRMRLDAFRPTYSSPSNLSSEVSLDAPIKEPFMRKHALLLATFMKPSFT